MSITLASLHRQRWLFGLKAQGRTDLEAGTLWKTFRSLAWKKPGIHSPVDMENIPIIYTGLYTPWKMNGWNLQITHLERKMIGTKPP